MADGNPPETTGVDEGQGQDVPDSDSGIGTGTPQSTPSQSESSTPNQSEMSTPTLSPRAPEGATEPFSFPPDVLSGLQISQTDATKTQESVPRPMETDSAQQQSEQHPPPYDPSGATATSAQQMEEPGSYQAPEPYTPQPQPPSSTINVGPATATRTAVPQMDRQGFYRTPQPQPHSAPTSTPSVPPMERRGVSQRPDPPCSTQPNEIQIFIKNFNGKTEAFRIRADASVVDLKKLVHNKMGVPPAQQRLNYEGRDLQDGNSLLDYGVRNLSTLNLLGRLRGGA